MLSTIFSKNCQNSDFATKWRNWRHKFVSKSAKLCSKRHNVFIIRRQEPVFCSTFVCEISICLSIKMSKIHFLISIKLQIVLIHWLAIIYFRYIVDLLLHEREVLWFSDGEGRGRSLDCKEVHCGWENRVVCLGPKMLCLGCSGFNGRETGRWTAKKSVEKVPE